LGRTSHREPPQPIDEATARAKLLQAMDNLIARARVPVEAQHVAINPFVVAEPVKGAVPAGEKMLAFDDASVPAVTAQWLMSMSFSEGQQFLGYPYLAEISQIGEYRKVAEIIATEMTREWIEFEAVGEKDKAAKISKIEQRLNELGARDVYSKSLVHDGFFGRGHVYHDTGDTDNPEELIQSIGDGRSDLSKQKVNKGHPLLAIRAIEATWCYPTTYNASNPLKPDWYKPDVWYVMGQRIHASRFLTIIGREVSDLLKPAYSFGGLALTQLVKPAVDNWRKIRSAVSDLISAFTVFTLSTDMAARLQKGGDEELFKRIQLFTALRDNRGVFLMDKDREEFGNTSAPLGTLDALQAQAQEHIPTLVGIPIVKYMGDTPAGLNASSEGAIRMFYDWIHAQQEKTLRPALQTTINFVQLSLFGEVDEDITFKFKPLWSLDEKAMAEVDDLKAKTAQTRIDSGVISPEEERTVQINEAGSPYNGLDPNDAPDLREEEEAGIEPVGGRPDPDLTDKDGSRKEAAE
jgi:phage-related protein (TIGR01555 family)